MPLRAISSFDTEFKFLLHGLRMAVQHSATVVVAVLTSGRHGSKVSWHTLSSILLLCRAPQGPILSCLPRDKQGRRFSYRWRGSDLYSTLSIFNSTNVDRNLSLPVRMDQLG